MAGKDYSGKWVARKGRTIVDSARTVHALMDKVSDEDISRLTLTKIPKKNCVCIL